MKLSQRTVLVLAVLLVVGTVGAFAIGVSMRGGSGAAMGTYGDQGSEAQGVLAETSTEEGAATPAADPAKEEPVLDKFLSKNPFVVVPEPNIGTSGMGTVVGAKVKVNGTTSTVVEGDKVPTSKPAFSIAAISSADVTFALLNGRQFEDGSSSVIVGVGEAVKVVVGDGNKSYTLSVVEILFKNSSGGGASGGGGGSHSISLLSISAANGEPAATIKVDGTTYSDKQVGDSFSTSWGEVKVLAINEGQQTVTVQHGDETIVLHAGQAVIK